MKNNLIILLILLLSLTVKAQKDSIYIKELLNKAYNYEQKKPDSALYLYDEIIAFSKVKGFPIFEAKAKNYKGIVFSDMGKYDSAVVYYNKSIAIFKDIHNEKGVAANLINIGNTFQLQGDLQNATSFYLDGIKIYEKIKDDYRTSISYSNLSAIFDDINQKEDAKKSLFKANKYALKTNDSVQLVYNYYNLTDLYFDENKIDSASITIKKMKNYLNTSSNNHITHLVSYGETRYYVEKHNYKKALLTSEKAIHFAEQTKNPYNIAMSYSLLGKVYFKQKHYNKALAETNKGLEIAKKYHHNINLISINNQLFNIYSEINNYKKALYHKELAYKYKDSILNEKQKKNINLINTKYQTEKKDKEILQQKLQIEQQTNELQKKKTQNNYILGIAIFLLIASLLIWIVFQQRQKRKNQEIVTLKREHQVKTLESLMEGEEKERFRIAKELHDGVNGDLSAIKFKLSSLLETNNNVIKEAISMIDNSCQQVRAISHNLVPPSLENFNLLEATEEYCINLDAVQPIQVLFQHIGNLITISKKAEVNIFRIIQELVTNSIKHSEASLINVQISCRENSLQITVEDNGKGFEKETPKSNGIGLTNVASRIDYLQATMDVISNKQGTSYTIEIDTNKLYDH